MSILILPTSEPYFPGLYRALDIVAREKKFLVFLQAPPIEEALAFYRNIVANDLCQFVALEAEHVIGWCDILPTHGESRAHVGTLGIALLPQARCQGLGVRLMEAALAKASAQGLTRIELTVRTDNRNAKVLNERFGFCVEGVQRRSMLIDGAYHDAYAMALLR